MRKPKKVKVCPSYIMWLMFAVLCAYNLLDAYQTTLLLNMGSGELNPLIQWYIGMIGAVLIGILTPKVFFLGLLAAGLVVLSNQNFAGEINQRKGRGK